MEIVPKDIQSFTLRDDFTWDDSLQLGSWFRKVTFVCLGMLQLDLWEFNRGVFFEQKLAFYDFRKKSYFNLTSV